MDLFGTSGIRGPVGEAVTGELALSVGRAIASEGADRIVLGRDPRETGEWLGDAVAAGARECGADVIDAGMVATPTLARAVGWEDADAGAVITASHNPPEDNGIKLWSPTGQAFDEDRRGAVERRIGNEAYDLRAWDETGSRWAVDDATERHVDALVETIGSIDDLSVVVDVGNGAGGITADALAAIGCEDTVLNGEPDGSFPNRPSEPTAENCRELCEAIVDVDADLGIAHDGDADRMRAATESGRFVSGDVLLALFAREAADAGDRVAVPVDTSLVVGEELASLGASVVRTPVGDVYVAERAREPDVVFGGEPSGAWIWPEETLCPDGPLAACKLAALVAREGSFDALVGEIDSPPLRRENVRVDRKEAVMERVRETIEDEYASDRYETLDGVRLEFDDGWILIRASGTQPLIRLTAEAHGEERADELLELADGLVSGQLPADGRDRR